MLLSRRQYRALYSNTTSSRRHGYSEAVQQWPGAIVPVEIDRNAHFDAKFTRRLLKAMAYISRKSCVKFEMNPINPPIFLMISRGDACASEVGRQSELDMGGQPRRVQFMKVGEHCSIGNLVHEFLHVLGFLHMHTATNRDDFVKINWNNVKPQAMINFERITARVSMFDTQYDYRSIMHYSPKAFAIDNKVKTIISREPVVAMGQRKGKPCVNITYEYLFK